MRRVLSLTACGLALAAQPAHAAGGPVSPAQGGAGVSAPGGAENFVAVGAGIGRTVVMRVSRPDAAVQRSRAINGSFGIPGVTYDGINTGLSADGRTLVLARGLTAYPQRATKLRVLDARSLRPARTITLPGMVTVDAISPTGRWLYLVDYKNGGVTEYDVRAYDLRRGRLLEKPVIDPRDPGEKLQGVPITRVQSGEGRWAYTLYAGDEPFIHALDTEGRTAVCIDLPNLTPDEIGAAKLALDGGALTVERDGTPLASVDLKTFKVTEPAKAAPKPTATPRAATTSDAGPPILLWAVPFLAFAALALAGGRRRRARR
jgi:hypothetical protein